jgi:hypothetical protein
MNVEVARALAQVDQLMAGDLWSQHPRHTCDDWKHQAGRGDTQLGYWEWVRHQIEASASANGNDNPHQKFEAKTTPVQALQKLLSTIQGTGA